VYGSGKLGKLDKDGRGQVAVSWYPGLQGERLKGMVTIIVKKNGKHVHASYEVYSGQTFPTIVDLNEYKIAGKD
jgi:hypothetical protein